MRRWEVSEIGRKFYSPESFVVDITLIDFFIFDDNANELPSQHDLKKVFERVFHVDELIALPVVELNKKGYITEGACSGHHFSSVCYEIEEEADPKEALFNVYDENVGKNLYYYEIAPDKEGAYVGFVTDYSFKTLPDGWYKKGITLQFKYPDGLSEYELYKKQIDAMQALHTWVCSLVPLDNESK